MQNPSKSKKKDLGQILDCIKRNYPLRYEGNSWRGIKAFNIRKGLQNLETLRNYIHRNYDKKRKGMSPPHPAFLLTGNSTAYHPNAFNSSFGIRAFKSGNYEPKKNTYLDTLFTGVLPTSRNYIKSTFLNPPAIRQVLDGFTGRKNKFKRQRFDANTIAQLYRY